VEVDIQRSSQYQAFWINVFDEFRFLGFNLTPKQFELLNAKGILSLKRHRHLNLSISSTNFTTFTA
jgi:hypothetical protein